MHMKVSDKIRDFVKQGLLIRANAILIIKDNEFFN